MVALVLLSFTGCKYQRTRRPRPPAKVAVKEEETLKPPPPRPEPPPPPPPPAAKPVERADRSPCGPVGPGLHYAVRGVDASDTLNVRVAPDPDSEVLGQLGPSTTGVADLGRKQKVGPSIWRKVRCGALIGWVNDRFLGPDSSPRGKATAQRM